MKRGDEPCGRCPERRSSGIHTSSLHPGWHLFRHASIVTWSAEVWGPLHKHEQSAYVEGSCEVCDQPIAPREVHLTRAWLNGPAEACEHITCPAQRGQR